MRVGSWATPQDQASPLRLDPAFILDLPPQTGLPHQTDRTFTLGLLLRLCLAPRARLWGGTEPAPSAQASPESRMTVTDTYNDFPTRASSREGCTPPSRTSRFSTASPVPSRIWGKK